MGGGLMAERFRIRFTRTASGVIANVSRAGNRWMVTAQELPTMEAAQTAAQDMVREVLALDAKQAAPKLPLAVVGIGRLA